MLFQNGSSKWCGLIIYLSLFMDFFCETDDFLFKLVVIVTLSTVACDSATEAVATIIGSSSILSNRTSSSTLCNPYKEPISNLILCFWMKISFQFWAYPWEFFFMD